MRRHIALALCGVLASSVAGSGAALAADPAAGRKKASACQACHGIDGLAKMPNAPHIAGENTLYLQNQLKAFRDGKRQHEIMSFIAANLSDEDIADLAAWYASIRITVEVPEP